MNKATLQPTGAFYESYPYALERQASGLGAALPLPEPDSGGWLLRLVRLPQSAPEVIVDVEKRGGRHFVTVSRFLRPLRRTWESLGRPRAPMTGLVPVEISISNLPARNAMALEIERGTPLECPNDPQDEPDRDHYLLFYTDTKECRIAAAANPYESKEAEAWHRLINRSYGAELEPPRRLFVESGELVG